VTQAVDPGSAAPGLTRGRPDWIVPAIIGSAMLMLTHESTVLANAVPTIARSLHEEPLRLNLAMTMYLLASAVALPLSGWVADKFGARRVLIAGMVLFAGSSAICGLAHSLLQLVGGRMLQGVAAAMMMPVARLVLLRTTPREELVGALAVFTIPPMVGPLIGPLLGGLIVTYFNWRWIFFINLPIGLIGIVLMRLFVPDVKEEEVPRIDIVGVLLTGIGLAAVVFGFENLGRDTLPGPAVAGLFVVAAISFVLYGRHSRGNPRAVIRLDLFRRRTFAAATLGGAFMRLGVGAMPFMLAMLLQVGFGMSALLAGAMTVISGLGAMFMKGVAPPLLRRYGFRKVMTTNIWLVAASFILMSFITPATPIWALMLFLGVSGFFRSLQYSGLGALAFADIEPPAMSGASTMFSVTQQVTQSLGIGLTAALVHGLQLARGDPYLTWRAVVPVFAILGVVSMLSLFWFHRLPNDAGAALTAPRSR
jgi:EmrB/QacA subfamily drug resistance transporter